MRKCVITIIPCLGLLSCQTTINQQPLPTNLPPISMEKADSNSDGNLDQEEFEQRLKVLFEIRDTDKDGKLSQSELPGVNTDAFQQSDQDQTGRLSKQEYFYLRYLDFNRLDADRDRILVPHELFRW